MYGLDKFGITGVKPSGTFASNVQRFNEKTDKERATAPGPGSYTSHKAWASKKQQAHKPEWQQVNWNR